MKIKPSPIIDDMSGKLGNVVFLRLPNSGIVARNRVIPFNPKSSEQEAARSRLTTISQAWGATLSVAERQAWDTYASQNPVVNSFGDSALLSGEDWFTRINGRLFSVGETTITTTVPTGSPPANPDMGGYTLSTTAMALFTVAAVPNTQEIRIWMTSSLPAGRKAQTPDYRLINNITGSGSLNQDLDSFTEYSSRFGAPVAGRNVAVRMDVVDAEGLLSSSVFLSTIVT